MQVFTIEAADVASVLVGDRWRQVDGWEYADEEMFFLCGLDWYPTLNISGYLMKGANCVLPS